MFPPELERDAFRSDNGEFGWTQAQIPTVVEILRSHRMGILGGELWWVRDGATDWELLPRRNGSRDAYVWTTNRRSGEPWLDFVERGGNEAVGAVQSFPRLMNFPSDLRGRIFFNSSDVEFDELAKGVG